MFDFCNSVGGGCGCAPVECLTLELLPTIFSTRVVVSRTTPDRSVRSGMCAENRLYMLVESRLLFGRRDSTYFSCCFRKMAFLSSSWVLLNEVRVSLKDFMALKERKLSISLRVQVFSQISLTLGHIQYHRHVPGGLVVNQLHLIAVPQ